MSGSEVSRIAASTQHFIQGKESEKAEPVKTSKGFVFILPFKELMKVVLIFYSCVFSEGQESKLELLDQLVASSYA